MNFTKEQELAINHFGNAVVSASAGSGKTAVMIEKTARLLTNSDEVKLDSPVEVSKILIVTFTNAVASELKNKVGKKLVELLQIPGSDEDFLIKQLESLPLANISTIHSMCSKLLREYYAVVGIDPAFTLMDEKEAKLYLYKAITLVLKEENKKPTKEFMILNKYFDLSFEKSLEDLYRYAINKVNIVNYLDSDALRLYKDEEYLKQMQNALKNYNLTKLNRYKKILNVNIKDVEQIGLFEKLLNMLLTLDRNIDKVISNSSEEQEEVGSAESDKTIDKLDITDKEKEFYKKYIKDIKKQKDKIKECISTYLTPVDAIEQIGQQDIELAEYLMAIVKKIYFKYKEIKFEEGKLDYNDLEHYAIELLQTSARDEILAKFDYIFVDEFQDINPVQEEILNLLSNGNNKFTVGDVKQSIYEFRNADPSIIINTSEEYKKDNSKGKLFALNKNFRSRKEIVDFVNEVFNELMTKEECGIDYKNDAQLVFGQEAYLKDTQELQDRVIVAQLEVEKNQEEYDENDLLEENNTAEEEDAEIIKDEIYSVREDYKKKSKNDEINLEAEYIFNEIKKHIDNKTQVLDEKLSTKDKSVFRSCQYSDIALLCRTRSSKVKRIISRLIELGLPIDLAGIEKEEECDSIDTINSFLETINNDYQSINLTKSILSIFGNFSIEELYKISSDANGAELYKAFDSYKNDDEIKAKIDAFRSKLATYKYESQFMPVSQLIEKIISENSYQEFVLSKEDGEKEWFDLRSFIKSLMDKTYNDSLQKYLDMYRNENVQATGAKGVAIANNCVKTYTYHASKGLEFPIVFCIDFSSKYKPDTNAYIKSKKAGIMIEMVNEQGVRNKSKQMEIASEVAKIDTLAERLRLLYVAFTRAREYLYITGTKKIDIMMPAALPVDAQTPNDYLEYKSQIDNNFYQKYCKECIVSKLDEKEEVECFDFSDCDIDVKKSILDKMNYTYAFEKATKSNVSRNVTELNKLNYEALEGEEEIKGSYMYKDKDSSTTPEAGTAYHKVLECLDFDDCAALDNVKEQLEKMVSDGDLTVEQKELINPLDIYSCMQSEIMQYARNNICEREKMFVMYVKEKEIIEEGGEDKVLLKGAIDLFIKSKDENGQNILVDFKYSHSDINSIKQRYEKQLELYKKAIEVCSGDIVHRRIIYVLGKNETIEY